MSSLCLISHADTTPQTPLRIPQLHVSQLSAYRPWGDSRTRVQVRHVIAQRVRLSVPLLRELGDLSQTLLRLLESSPGIVSARFKAPSASLVVERAEQGPSVEQLRALIDDWLQTAWPLAVDSAEPHRRSAARAVASPRGRPAGRRAAPRRLTWALADVPLHRFRKESRASRGLDGAPGQQPAGVAAQARCRLCDLYLRLLRWMTRMTLRCWRSSAARSRSAAALPAAVVPHR